jgi:hypothetical protein
MKTLYLALGISALAAVAFAVSFYLGVDWYRDKRALDDARDYIEGTQDADEAVDDVRSVGACSWLRETFGGEGCGVAGPNAPAD